MIDVGKDQQLVYEEGFHDGYKQAMSEYHKQKTAHWKLIDPTGTFNFDSVKCSCCGCIMGFRTMYCPNCGAEMDKEERT